MGMSGDRGTWRGWGVAPSIATVAGHDIENSGIAVNRATTSNLLESGREQPGSQLYGCLPAVAVSWLCLASTHDIYLPRVLQHVAKRGPKSPRTAFLREYRCHAHRVAGGPRALSRRAPPGARF